MKSVLITGANGFVGETLKEILSQQFEILTLGLNERNLIVCNLSNEIPKLSKTPDYVIHAAGKAHSIPKNDKEALDFHQINYQGTLNLLEGLTNTNNTISQFIFLSTVAVYGMERGENIAEDWPLKGDTPYAKSKIMAEKAVVDWCNNHNVRYIILRLPLVVGEKAPGNLGAIKRAILKGHYFRIEGNHAKKSVVLAEDIAALIPNLDGKQGIFNLTDGINPSFFQIETAISKEVNKPINWTLPMFWAKTLAIFGDLLTSIKIPFPLTSDKLMKLTSTLTFDDRAARETLGWQPKSAF
ncbi:MAG: NAD-dependent epimerase/dehydratase family protein [Saprospiraceae bacterium]|nr:NAD-dependent epimerase/dehydratase family protein [Saprospiraceae bacterium]